MATNQQVIIEIIARTKESGGGVGGLVSALKGSINWAQLAGKAVKALIELGKESVDIWQKQELAEKKLAGVIKATGEAAGYSRFELMNMARALSEVTNFSDGAIMNGQALMLTFTNIGKDVFPRAQKAMLDMSATMGTDLKASAIQLGKALQDPIKGVGALSDVGVGFTKQQKDTIASMMDMNDIAGAQGIILGELERQMGGVAEEMASGSAGSATIYKNALDSLKGELGQVISMGLDPLRDALAGVVIQMSSTFAATNDVRDAFKQFRDELKETGGLSLSTLDDALVAINQKIAQNTKDSEKWWSFLGRPQLDHQNKKLQEQADLLQIAIEKQEKQTIEDEKSLKIASQMADKLSGSAGVQAIIRDETQKTATAAQIELDARQRMLKLQETFSEAMKEAADWEGRAIIQNDSKLKEGYISQIEYEMNIAKMKERTIQTAINNWGNYSEGVWKDGVFQKSALHGLLKEYEKTYGIKYDAENKYSDIVKRNISEQKDAEAGVAKQALTDYEARMEFQKGIAEEQDVAHEERLERIAAEKEAEDEAREAKKELELEWDEQEKEIREAAFEQAMEHQEAEDAARRESIAKAIEGFDMLMSSVSTVIGAISDLTGAMYDRQIQNITNERAATAEKYNEEIEAINNSTMSEEEKAKAITDIKARAAAEDTKLYEQEKALKIKAFNADKTANVLLSIINTAVAVTKALASLPPPFNFIAAGAAGIAGAIQTGIIASQPAPAFALGGDFLTSGPQMIQVGDNPGGVERVSVTPLSSPNVNGPAGMTHITINLGSKLLWDEITQASRDGNIIISPRAVR